MTTTRKSLLPQQTAPVVRSATAAPAGLCADGLARTIQAAQVEGTINDEHFGELERAMGDEDAF